MKRDRKVLKIDLYDCIEIEKEKNKIWEKRLPFCPSS
jgi:hypothetical protein